MAKKLVAARDLPAGHTLTEADIAMKSPGDGLPPYELDRVLGPHAAPPRAGGLGADLRVARGADPGGEQVASGGTRGWGLSSTAASRSSRGRRATSARCGVRHCAPRARRSPGSTSKPDDGVEDGRRHRSARRCAAPWSASPPRTARRRCWSTTPASTSRRTPEAARRGDVRGVPAYARGQPGRNVQRHQVFGGAMVEAGRGSIINIGSLYASVAPEPRFYDHMPGFLKPAAYGASKAGVVQLTRYFARRWGPHGVRVNALSPGGVARRPGPGVPGQVLRPRPARPDGRPAATSAVRWSSSPRTRRGT